MATTTIPMDIDDDESTLSETDTWIYDDQDIDSSEDEITDNNWRYIFEETLNKIQENKLNDGARPLRFDGSCQIRIKNLGDTIFTFPLSTTLCSRMICEHGTPLTLSNKYDFCGTKIINSAWQVEGNLIDFTLPFSAAVQSSALEQLHLHSSNINTHFDLKLNKLIMFGPCLHTKTYNFDDKLFIYHATVLVFLPSYCTGGTYRFLDDNGDDEDTHRHTFNQQESNNFKPFILVLPSDCQHEIEPIEKGFKILLVYHLVSKTNSIHQLYSLLSNSNNDSMKIENALLIRRLTQIFTYWENNLDKMPIKLLIPLQHPLDYSSYFSLLFRDKYRIILGLVMTAMKHFSSFLVYSAILQHDEPFGKTTHSRFLVHNLTLLNTSNEITLDLNSQHERTVMLPEFVGELHPYTDAFEGTGSHPQVLYNGNTVFRNDEKFHVLVLIPYKYQWDLLLDDHLFACHHLAYLFTLPTNCFNDLCLNFFDCILRDKLSSILSFNQLIHYLILLRKRLGLTPRIIQLIENLFQHKQFREEFFSNPNFHYLLNRLVESFSAWSMFSIEFLDLFRELVTSSMPIKINEIIQFLLHFQHKPLRCLLINTLLRIIFKPRGLPRHILFSTLCSLLHLLILDDSYSLDALLTLAYNIIKRARKTSTDNEIIDKSLRIHLIPMLINIYRDIQQKEKRFYSIIPISPAFVLIYEYCLNTLNYYCSTSSSSSSSSSPLNIISMNEALLICPCASCARLQLFLIDQKSSTLIFDLSATMVIDHCLRHTLSKFPMLSIEYKHDPCTGREQTVIISKFGYEQEQKQLCFHLRRLLRQLHKI